MDSKNIIIVLLVIIIMMLACIMGAMFLPSLNAQKDSKIVITGNNTLYAGDNLTLKLTDLNETPIEHAIINVTITDGEGNVVTEESLKTNSKGNVSMNLDLDAGNYSVNVTFGGNDNFTGNNTAKKISIEEVVVEETYTQQSTSSYSSSGSSGSNSRSSSQSEYRPAVDSGGITREEADYWGWQYTPDHGGHYHGYRDHWDENAGVYHD